MSAGNEELLSHENRLTVVLGLEETADIAAQRRHQADGVQASEQTIMAVAGHASREMLERYSPHSATGKRKAGAESRSTAFKKRKNGRP